MKTFFPQITGNETLRKRIGREFLAGTHSHAYIIEGAQGSGKHTLARNMAMAAACLHRREDDIPLPCGTCKFCRKIAAGNCPDILYVSRPEDKTTISVDIVRALRENIAVVPNDLDVKVYIIEDAHTMTVQAQNALLLTLEEPPPFVLFLLLTEDADALLETVRSRAPIFRMQPIARGELRRYLLDAPTARSAGAAALATDSPAEFEALLMLADGKIGVALDLLDPKKRLPLLTRRKKATEILTLLGERSANDRLLLLLYAQKQNREERKNEFAMLLLALRDLILLSRNENVPLVFFTDRDEALGLADRFTTKKLLAVYDAVQKANDALHLNANVGLTITKLLTELFALS